MYSADLNFYQVRLRVESNDEFILEDIKRDFAYFVSRNDGYDINIAIFMQEPPYELVPHVKASLYLPAAIAYDCKNKRYVDYQGQALTIYDYNTETGFVYSQDKNLIHEISYLLILSRVGELLDKKGIHRIHALGVTVHGRAVLCLLPMGAGKTTLALDLLKEEDIKLLSDDIVLVDRKGQILPFPLRIGVNKGIKLDIPPNFLRELQRRQYGAKILIDLEYFKGQIGEESKPRAILIGEREYSNQAKIKPTTKLAAIGPLFQNGIIGFGLPQMVEYFLRNNFRDFNKLGLFLARIFFALKIIMVSKVYKFTIGLDRGKNIKVLLDFLANA